MTLSEFLSQYPGHHVCINDCGAVSDGEPNLDVLIWATERESVNDDGRRAIAREMVFGEQPAMIMNGDVAEIDNTLIAEAREAETRIDDVSE